MARRRYAKVWWMVGDVSERAKESGVELTREGARQLLESSEQRLEEAMIVAGWTVIEDALSGLGRPQGR
jgi:hypothetical protein